MEVRTWSWREVSRVVLACLAAASVPPAAAETPRRPSVLVVSIDTLRRDHVSAYGYLRTTTPALDALAAEGALFERAVSTSNWTLPAHVSMLTGLRPSSHGVESERDAIPTDLVLLSEVLRDAGYATAGFASHVYLDGRYGFERGFDTWQVRPNQRASELSARSLEWLEAHEREPFFLFLHYFDPHWDYDPPPPFDARFGTIPASFGRLPFLFPFQAIDRPMPREVRRRIVALYDAEIAYTDHELGRVFAWLRDRGRLDDTIVVVVSDHGEEFGERGSFGHGAHLHGEVTWVPMIVRYPRRVAGGTRRSDLASLLDLPATVAGLASVDAPPQFSAQGADLFAADRAPEDQPRHLVIESSREGPKRFAILGERLKVMTAARYRPFMFHQRKGEPRQRVRLEPIHFAPGVFDIRLDRGERRDLSGRDAEREARLRDELVDFVLDSSRGVRVLCDERAGPRVEGFVELDLPLADEVFPLPTGRASSQRLGPKRHRVSLEPDAGLAGLLFPTTRSSGGALRVELSAGESPAFGGAWTLGAAEVTHELGPPSAPNACRIEYRPPREGIRTIDLTPEDQEKLRALGYAE